MNDKKLMKIALNYIEKGYNIEDLMYGDDLYNSSEEEKDRCGDFFCECRDIGTVNFKKKIDAIEEQDK